MSSKRKTILYFAPHQDDELLSMGIDICSNIQKGHDVHVILCSDGSKSNVKNVLNNGKSCPKHQGEHVYNLSVEEFIQARDKEFMDSCHSLGVKSSNIHIPENRGIDGSLSVETSETIIKHYLSLYGNDSLVCTISPDNGKSQHRDHKALGMAANNLLTKGNIKEVKFFIEPYHFGQIVDNPRLIPIAPTIEKAAPHVAEKLKGAINSYSYWNPDEQRYAVGYHSVTSEFNDFLAETTAYSFNKKLSKNMSLSERISWRHKKWQKLQNQRQLYYSLSSCQQPDLGDLTLVEIPAKDTDSYKKFCAKHGLAATKKNLKRISDGSSFWCLLSADGDIVSDGWLAYQHHFYISETDYDFDMGNSKVGLLYNFNTREKYRGKGYYGLLLKSIVHNAKEPENFIIYTAPDNTSSANGITKAGFSFDGALSTAEHSMKPYLQKHGFSSIRHKYQLWGLRVIE